MQRARSGSLRLVIVIAAALAAVRCSKDDIPTTPAPPFIITDVAISKFVDPAVTTVVPVGIRKFRFDVSYTLSSADDSRRANLSVVVAAFRTDTDSLLTTASFSPGNSGSTVHDSIIVTIPTGTTGLELDGGVLYVPLDTIVAFSYGPSWTVK